MYDRETRASRGALVKDIMHLVGRVGLTDLQRARDDLALAAVLRVVEESPDAAGGLAGDGGVVNRDLHELEVSLGDVRLRLVRTGDDLQ